MNSDRQNPFTWLRWAAYRALMRLAHKHNWHYAPPIYPEGDTQLWCKWCGFRHTIHRHGAPSIQENDKPA